MIKIGTRKSILAVAQAELISSKIRSQLGVDTEIVKISSLGDEDQVSKLTSFRGQGVFTSRLEHALAEGEIDIAVHSLKDLPVRIRQDLPIVAYYHRDRPGDSLIVKSDLVVSTDPLQLKEGIRVATGSLRRQIQFIDRFPTAVPVDIRGNVHTRLSRLKTTFIDALIMATAVFDRINIPIPEGLLKIDLDPTIFYPAPGQGTIAVQVRAEEFEELVALNDYETERCVTTERKILEAVGGGCELSLGAYIYNYQDRWYFYVSFADERNDGCEKLQLSKYHFTANTPKDLLTNFLDNFSPKINNDPTDLLHGKIVVLVRDHLDVNDYYEALATHGAVVLSQPIFSYSYYWDLLKDNRLLKAWNEAEWIVLSSQRTISFLCALNSLHPRSKRYAVIGRKTSSVMRKYGFPVHLVAGGGMESLSTELSSAAEVYPGNILYLSGEDVSKQLELNHIRVAVYKAEIQSFHLNLVCDYLVIFSSRSGQAILEQTGANITKTWVAIGGTTKQDLTKLPLKVIQATSPSPEGVVAAILEDLL